MVLVIDSVLNLGRYDAVTYLKYLDTLRVSESFRSVWIFAESSYKIFEYAKKRVYRFVKSDGTKLSGMSKSSTSKKRKMKGDNDKEGENHEPFVLHNSVLDFLFIPNKKCITYLKIGLGEKELNCELFYFFFEFILVWITIFLCNM